MPFKTLGKTNVFYKIPCAGTLDEDGLCEYYVGQTMNI